MKAPKRWSSDTPTTLFHWRFMLLLAVQLALSCLLVITVLCYQMQQSMPPKAYILPRPYAHVTRSRSDPAALQRALLDHVDSWMARVYHPENSSKSLRGTSGRLRAVSLKDFCGKKLGKAKQKYAIFRDVILAERKLYLPTMNLNCSEMRAEFLINTRFNKGQGSTPKIDALVVPEADTFEDMEPHFSCHERVYEPTVLSAFINWPQYGHAMFNGISLLWELFNQSPLRHAGGNVRLYVYADTIDETRRLRGQEFSPFFDLEELEPLRSMFTDQPARSLANLLLQSDSHPVCFSYLVTGLSGGTLDHYNFRAPLALWRDFSVAVRAHFGVTEPPREPRKEPSVFLQRVAPADALRGSDPVAELGPIRRPRWEEMGPGRPRLTILDRRSNRVIINVAELEQLARRSGLFRSVEVAYAEGMDVGAQVRMMGETDVLMGMDGTGLMNGIFMAEGGVVVHVRPYGCSEFLSGKGINFDRLFAASPGRVIRHESRDRKTTRSANGIPEMAEIAFYQSSPSGYRFGFILKQDTIVDPAAFRCILESSHKLLHGVPVDWQRHFACTRSVFA